MNLHEIQTRLQNAILNGDDAILPLIPDSARECKETLLGVYRSGYALRLVEILGGDYEKLNAYMGEEAFDTAARAYIAAHPSRYRSARWLGNDLASFLASTQPYDAHPELSDLARLEGALNDAFDAPDASTVNLATLAAHAPEAWPDLAFMPHPCTRRLDLATNAASIWAALAEVADVPPPEALETSRILVWRQDASARFRSLGVEEAMMWAEAAKGVRFGVLCEMLGTFDDPDSAAVRAANYLKGWIDGGLLTEAHLARA